MEHTKGPWLLAETHAYTRVVRSKNAELGIAGVEEWKTESKEKQEEAKANAKLIAAAPELLSACREALADLEDSTLSLFDDVKLTIVELKAAINKATT